GRKPEEVRRNWEGKKGMKRMKKKVVAMVTLAMFVMSMLPMAAFAAPDNVTGNGYPEYSELTTEDTEIAVNDTATIKATVLQQDGITAGTVAPVRIWVENAKGESVRGFQLSFDGGKSWKNTPYPTGGALADGQEFLVKCTVAGEYTVHAGQVIAQPDGAEKMVEFAPTEVINVSAEEVNIDKIQVANANPQTDKGGSLDFGKKVPNGVNSVKVTATITVKKNEETGVTPSARGQVVTIDNPYNNIAIVDSDDNNAKAITEVKADAKNQVEFYVRPDATVADGYYIITLEVGGVSYDLTIKIGEDNTDVKTLEVVDTDATVVANTASTLESVAKFVAKDEKGNVVAKDTAAMKDLTDVKVLTEPNKNKATLDVEKIADEDAYTLKVSNGTLAVGDYVVRVALDGERSSVDLKFTVDKFGEAVDIKFGDVKESGKVVDGDEVVIDKTYIGEILLVDKNGVTKTAAQATIGVDGAAAENVVLGSGSYQFEVKSKIDGETSVGSEITVTVYDSSVKKNIQKVFTVVESEDANTLAFDSEAGKVQNNNTVEVSLVDKNGKVVKEKANQGFGYYVASQSNQDANIYVNTTSNLNEGKGKITVYSDKETTAEIVVYVKIDNKVYGNTLKYTFGAEDVLADTSVVMTLGSTEMLVNNKIVDMKDAAPMATQNRTFVPFRPLGEALGAQVDYDKDAKTVTYTLGGTKIVMTLDSKTYTVNGAEKTMDVAPFAKDNRTYVPVRFVGEALGFKVTGLQDGNGKYVAVAFTK
ncbi:MAG: copper amine oxidase N-terminal domain-containing protein, partial [Peptococcaceae bacterium]